METDFSKALEKLFGSDTLPDDGTGALALIRDLIADYRPAALWLTDSDGFPFALRSDGYIPNRKELDRLTDQFNSQIGDKNWHTFELSAGGFYGFSVSTEQCDSQIPPTEKDSMEHHSRPIRLHGVLRLESDQLTLFSAMQYALTLLILISGRDPTKKRPKVDLFSGWFTGCSWFSPLGRFHW